MKRYLSIACLFCLSCQSSIKDNNTAEDIPYVQDRSTEFYRVKHELLWYMQHREERGWLLNKTYTNDTIKAN